MGAVFYSRLDLGYISQVIKTGLNKLLHVGYKTQIFHSGLNVVC